MVLFFGLVFTVGPLSWKFFANILYSQLTCLTFSMKNGWCEGRPGKLAGSNK